MASVSDKIDRDVNGAALDFKQKYKLLKSKMKFLVYEHEALLDDLKKAQKKLLHVSRDRSFLLDRLLAYEKVGDSSSDEDTGASSDTDSEKAPARAGKRDAAVPEKSRKREITKATGEPPKKRLKAIRRPRGAASAAAAAAPAVAGTSSAAAAAAVVSLASGPKSTSTPQPSREDVDRRRRGEQRSKAAVMPPLSREEIERHLESRPRLLALEKAPLHMPAEIFSNEASNADSDDATSDNDLDQSDLIIDSKWDI